MAVVWGAWVQRDSDFRQRVGIDLSVSGTTITARYYLETTGSISQSARNLTRTGAVTGALSYAWSESGAGVKEITAAKATKTGTRGSSYTFGASFPIYYGATASVSNVSITVPAGVPSKPATPSISNISSGAFQINYTYPAGNGATVNGMRIQVSNVSNFSSFVWNYIDADGSPAGPYGLEANRQYYVRIAARNSAGEGPFSDVVTPSTAPLPPLEPSNVVLTRVSDTSQTVSWQTNVTGERPVTQVLVNRRDNTSLALVRVATLSGAATSFTDTTTVGNRRYEYIVSAVNSGGQSGWTVSTAINTRPLPPASIGAVKNGANIDVMWYRRATYIGVTQTVVQDNPDGTGWVTVATVGAVDSWTHTGADPSKTHQYRVQVKSTVNAVIDSEWSPATNVVQLVAPPLAPTVTAPSVSVVDRSLPVRVAWTHNPVDTTAQTQFQVQWRVNSGAWTQSAITAATGFTGFYDIPAIGTSGVLDVQVRTRGEHATFGPWSAVKSVSLAATPSVSVNAPANGSVLALSRVSTSWGYAAADSSPQAQWEATLKSGGVTVEALAGTSAATTATFKAALADRQTYSVQVRVRSASGLWSAWGASSFTTDFPTPVTVEPIPEWDTDAGAVSLTFTTPDSPATYAWTGAANASPSTRTSEGITLTNSFPDPSFETTAHLPAGTTRTTDWAAEGSSSMRVPDHTTAAPGATLWGLSAWGLTPWGQ